MRVVLYNKTYKIWRKKILWISVQLTKVKIKRKAEYLFNRLYPHLRNQEIFSFTSFYFKIWKQTKTMLKKSVNASNSSSSQTYVLFPTNELYISNYLISSLLVKLIYVHTSCKTNVGIYKRKILRKKSEIKKIRKITR